MTKTDTNDALAEALINTTQLPHGLTRLRDQAQEARAYDSLTPYPLYWFRDWKTETLGPLPRCMPMARSIVARGARWLFGRPPVLHCPANPALERYLRDAWRRNRMPVRLAAAAHLGALEGGVVIKFGYDETVDPALVFQVLSAVEQVRLYAHPHNRDRILMARIQYPYTEPSTGKAYWYREEWTDREMVLYRPLTDEMLFVMNGREEPDSYGGWQIARRSPNPFGQIPMVYIPNRHAGDLWGAGDLWDLYRVLDRIHLTYHLMDRSNQFDGEINPIFIDASVDDQDFDRALQPGQPIQIDSKEGGHQAQVHLPEARGSLRPAMIEYARDLRRQVLAAASSVEVDQSEFTNKGNLTVAVLQQLYQPQIQLTEEKRRCYGEYGIAVLLSLAARGLQKIGVPMGITTDPATSEVTLTWLPYFEMSEEEKTVRLGRVQQELAAGLLEPAQARTMVLEMENLPGRAGDIAEELPIGTID